MTVEEVIEMFTNPKKQRFNLWSNKKEDYIFSGYITELSKKRKKAIVTSIDNVEFHSAIINLNVDE